MAYEPLPPQWREAFWALFLICCFLALFVYLCLRMFAKM
jgi:hypothetical protein